MPLVTREQRIKQRDRQLCTTLLQYRLQCITRCVTGTQSADQRAVVKVSLTRGLHPPQPTIAACNQNPKITAMHFKNIHKGEPGCGPFNA